MERLWYNLSPNVLEEMLKFVSRSKDENIPEFLLEIEAVTPMMDRYLLNLVDATNITIYCLTSDEYSKIFSVEEAIVGSVIRILRYWLFRIQCYFSDRDKDNFKYIIMITNAEIVKLPPTKPIVSLTRPTSKTPRIRGIVDVSPHNVSCTSDGGSSLRFRLSDNTGSIGCSAPGAMYASLHSILKEGVKVQLSHAVVTEVEPEYKMCNSNFELELNRFSVLNIYDPDDLTLLFTYSPRNIVKEPDRCPIVNLSDESSNTSSKTSKLSSEPSSSQQKCLPSSQSSIQPTSCQNESLPLSKSSIEPSSSQQKCIPSSKSSIQPTSFQNESLPLSKSSIELSSSQQKCIPSSKSLSEDASFQKESLPSLQSSSQPSSSEKKSLQPSKPSSIISYSQQKCMNGKTPIQIASLTKTGICNSWIRGVVEDYNGSLLSIRTNLVFIRFYLRDDSAVIRCTVWDSVCDSLHSVLKDGMILEIADAQVRQVPEDWKLTGHDYEISLTKYSTVLALSHDGALLYRHEKHQSTVTNLDKDTCQSKSFKSSMILVPKYIDGILPKNISSLTKEGYCTEWIRGIVENYVGVATTRTNRIFTRFLVHDNTGIISCTVWQPICGSLIRILKESMIVEIKGYQVSSTRASQTTVHSFQIYLNSRASIRVFTADGTLVHEQLAI